MASMTFFGQTTMTNPVDLGKVKVWEMSSDNTSLGKVYTIESNAKCELVFNPTKEDISSALMVVTGTYTSATGQVAGFAYKGNQNVGDQFDAFTQKANSYLVFANGIFSFSDNPLPNSVQVYRLIENGEILSDIVNARTKNLFEWRFLVQKSWTRLYENQTTISGTEFLVVDFSQALTLSQACDCIQGLQRFVSKYYDQIKKMNYSYSSSFTACILDTGVNYPFLLNGKNVHGNFSVASQSNVIVVK